MKHHTLIIHEMDDDLDDQEREIVKVRLAPGTDPATATLTVLQALQGIKPPRKTRSDAGHPKKPATAAA